MGRWLIQGVMWSYCIVIWMTIIYTLRVHNILGWDLIGTLISRISPLQIMIFRTGIGFRLNINNQIDIDQFFINSLHVWRWWQIISWRSRFRMCLFIVFYLIVTSKYQKSNLRKIIVNSFTVCVRLSHSLFSRKSVYQHRKHVCVSFIQVLSKDFESYSLADFQEWLLYNTGVISESKHSF